MFRKMLLIGTPCSIALEQAAVRIEPHMHFAHVHMAYALLDAPVTK